MRGSAAETLLNLASQATAANHREWLDAQFRAAQAAEGRRSVLVAFAGAGRRLGSAAIDAASEVAKSLPVPVAGWTADDAARVALLLAAFDHVPEPERVGFVEDLYFRGELGEKRAVLRALPLLPGSERFTPLAVEACRTNVVGLFEAIAVGNPFPGKHFDEPSFNQLVMKALFLGVTARGILGVEARVTSELTRMLDDYKSERVAAGRPVPDDLGWIMALALASPRHEPREGTP
jgi:hypothetical protein